MTTGCVYIDGLRALARANASTLHELRRHFAAHTELKAKLQWEADSVTLKRNGTSLRDPAAKAWLLRATASALGAWEEMWRGKLLRRKKMQQAMSWFSNALTMRCDACHVPPAT